MFDDIGLGINIGKCAAHCIKRGKYYKDAELPIGDHQIIKVLEKGDKNTDFLEKQRTAIN